MPVVDKRAVASAFGRSAKDYDSYAELQRRCGERLLTFAGDAHPASVLDAGCGTGTFSRRWRQRGARVVALDLSREMLIQARRYAAAQVYLQGDIEALPLVDRAFDLAWSNLAVQWCASLEGGLSALKRTVRPGGLVLFSTLCADSLYELRQAWRALDDRAHINRFLTPQQVTAAAGSALVEYACEPLTVNFTSALSAMRSLKGVGATHLHSGRGGHALTRARLQQLSQAWPRETAAYPLTYRLFYGVLICE